MFSLVLPADALTILTRPEFCIRPQKGQCRERESHMVVFFFYVILGFCITWFYVKIIFYCAVIFMIWVLNALTLWLLSCSHLSPEPLPTDSTPHPVSEAEPRYLLEKVYISRLSYPQPYSLDTTQLVAKVQDRKIDWPVKQHLCINSQPSPLKQTHTTPWN